MISKASEWHGMEGTNNIRQAAALRTNIVINQDIDDGPRKQIILPSYGALHRERTTVEGLSGKFQWQSSVQ
jgi:hypothetical protein